MLRGVLRAGAACRASRTVVRSSGREWETIWGRPGPLPCWMASPPPPPPAAASCSRGFHGGFAWPRAPPSRPIRSLNCSMAQRAVAARPGLAPAAPAAARPFAGSAATRFRSANVAAAAEYGNTDVQGASELIQSGASTYADVRCAAPDVSSAGLWVHSCEDGLCDVQAARPCTARRLASGSTPVLVAARGIQDPMKHTLPLFLQDARGVCCGAPSGRRQRARVPQAERPDGAQPAVPAAGKLGGPLF